MAELLVTQIRLEILTASGGSAAVAFSGPGTVTQMVLEVLATSTVSLGVAVGMLDAYVQHIVSGVSVVNVVGLTSLVVSSEWIVSSAQLPVTYEWTFGDVGNEAGFVSDATTSAIRREFQFAGGLNGRRRVSTTVSDLSADSLTSAFFFHIAATRQPAAFDGHFVKESQQSRLVWPI